MRVIRLSTALQQAGEAILIVLLGIAIPFAPLVLVWLVDLQMHGDLALMWRAAVDTWLLGHGVDIGVTLETLMAQRVGIADAERPFVVTLAALGGALLTGLMAARAGTRLASSRAPLTGALAGAAVIAIAGGVLSLTAQHATVAPNIGQAFALPVMPYLVGLGAGWLARRGSPVDALGDLLAIGPRAIRLVHASLVGGLGAIAGLLGAGALLLSVGLLVHFSDVVVLLESFQPTHLGVVVLVVGLLALLPTASVWATAWMIGPGFALGEGSSVSPIATQLGPVPSVPLVAVIPTDPPPIALGILAVPVLVGALIGVLLRQRTLPDGHASDLAIVAVGSAVVGGLGMGLVAWAASGAAGPGRLQVVGPDPLMVGAIAAAELAIGLALGIWLGRRRVRDAVEVDDDAADASAAAAATAGAGTASAIDRDGDTAVIADPRPEPPGDEQPRGESVAEAPVASDDEASAARPNAAPDGRADAGGSPWRIPTRD